MNSSYIKMLKELNDVDKKSNHKQNIVIISNITLGPFLEPYLKQWFVSHSMIPNILEISYNEYKCKDACQALQQADIILVWINYEFSYPDISNSVLSCDVNLDRLKEDMINGYQTLYAYIEGNTDACIMWIGLEGFYNKLSVVLGDLCLNSDIVDSINQNILNAISPKNVLIDLKKVIAHVGIINAYDFKNKYRWGCPYSEQLMQKIAAQVYKQYCIIKGKSKKCIVLDCDNVLWGGILSEDGIENIQLGSLGLGRLYQDFQRHILSLYHLGVILAISSKNDLKDVLYLFDNHSGMVIKKENISCFQVNWGNKVDSIRKISEILNIGMDSIVFIDDSIYEIEAVKSMIPEVTTITFEKDTILDKLSCFNLSSNINKETVRERMDTYRSNQQRAEIKQRYQTHDEYLLALETKIYIREATPTDYYRLSELSQRTNKCTNGRRYTVSELKQQIKNKNYMLYVVSVSDKYGDLGIVGEMAVKDDLLDLFALSCRALGRKIEREMISFIEKNHQVKSFYFCSTEKNQELKDLLGTYFEL